MKEEEERRGKLEQENKVTINRRKGRWSKKWKVEKGGKRRGDWTVEEEKKDKDNAQDRLDRGSGLRKHIKIIGEIDQSRIRREEEGDSGKENNREREKGKG